MGDFLMPSLGADMESGTLRGWLKNPGEHVEKGDVLAEVETDKGIVEIECFESGTLEKTLAEPDDRVPVGAPLAYIRPEGEDAPPARPPRPERRPRVSPRARRRARELGVALESLTGTGPDGAIVEEDIERAARAQAPAERPVEDRAAAMRRAIGAAMAKSKREIPHYYLRTTVDFSPVADFLARLNELRPAAERILPVVVLAKATAVALRSFPELNGHFVDGDHRPAAKIHVGMAIALKGGGLVAPALHDTDRQSLDELMKAFQSLVQRAKAGLQRGSEITDATITLTSLGDRGVEIVYPVIHPPQVAIVGAGRVVTRPWVVDDTIVPRPLLDLTLAADHRASSGHRGSLFLARLAELLGHPETL